jgi:DNA repair ATPase RecN
MDIEGRLRQLERHYRSALSAAVVAKASYLALVDEPSALPAAVERANARWQQLEALKRGIAVEMAQLEELEHESTT